MKIVIKIGSSLTSKENKFNKELIKEKVKEISGLYRENTEIVIISSGAVACGMEIENLKTRPKDTLKLQLLSGEGQVLLMKYYKEFFDLEGIKISQVLLTHHNLDTPKEKETTKAILDFYVKEKIIPIINENDLINKEEIEKNKLFTDNDILAALVAKELGADLLLILTDVDGLYNTNPKNGKNSSLILKVNKIDDSIKKMASKETNALGLGGMYSKIIAAEILAEDKINTIVANGNFNINDILENKVKRTLFRTKQDG
jgi:glutamate 5-kinase